jgi:hypothetical protein
VGGPAVRMSNGKIREPKSEPQLLPHFPCANKD